MRDYEGRIDECWKKYAQRNRELAHLAANLLLLLALLSDCRLICGENLTTSKPKGVAVGCGDAGGTGATIRRCAENCGELPQRVIQFPELPMERWVGRLVALSGRAIAEVLLSG